jgi:hypothetical protein
MKRTVLLTLILPKSQLTPREQSVVPADWRYGRKRLRITVEADDDMKAIELATKAAYKRYPDARVEIVKINE